MTDDYPTRRRYLQAFGGLTLLSTAGCPGSTPEPTEAPETTPIADTPTNTETETSETEESFGQTPTGADVVNLVEAGASPNGDEPTVPVLEEAFEDGKTLFFPPGEYLLAQEWRAKGFSDLTIIGQDATLLVEEGFNDNLFILGDSDGSSGLTVENLTFDVSAPNTGARPIHGIVEDGLSVSDVRVTGTQDVDQDSLRFDVTDPDGTGVIKRLQLPDGGDPTYRITGCYVGEAHTGTIRFVDCHIAGFPDNGLYASPATGTVIVEGGRYENNNISNVRVSGPAEVRGVSVRCDNISLGFPNMRGIRLREGTDVLVEDCDIHMERVAGSDGAITLSNWLDAATIRNTDITINADDVPAILAKSPTNNMAVAGDYRIRIENVTVSGSAAGTAAIRLLEREGCLVDNVCILQTGAARDGVNCTRVSDSTLSNSSISVTGTPVVLNDASVAQSGLQTRRLAANSSVDASGCQ